MGVDLYVVAWQSKRGTWDQLLWNKYQWEREWRWAEERRKLDEQWAEEERRRKEIAEIVERMEPTPNWYGGCLLAPNGDIYPIHFEEEHDTRAVELIRKLYPEEAKTFAVRQRFLDGLRTLYRKGWVRVDRSGNVTDGDLFAVGKVTQAQRDALWDMADRKETGVGHGYRRETFGGHLRRTVESLGVGDFAFAV